MTAQTRLGYHAACGGAVVLTEWEEARPGDGWGEPMAHVGCLGCGDDVDPETDVRPDPDSALEEAGA